jgi:von Willebrand factor type A domain
MKAAPRISVLVVMLCLFPENSLAQDDTCSKFLIPLTVRDTRGEVIHDFSAHDLEIKVNGNIQQAESIRRDNRPRRIVILLDASGSMRGFGAESPWRQAVSSAQMVTNLSEGRAQVALLIFNEMVGEEIGFARDNTAIIKRVNALQKDQEFRDHSVQGTTHLFDTVSHALQLLKHPSSADTIYIASDAGENKSHLMHEDIQRELGESGVRVFLTLLINPPNYRGRSPEEISGPQDTSTLVERTGGERMSLTRNEISLGFQTKPNRTPLERMYYQGLFDNDLLQIQLAPPQSKKRDLKIALSPAGRDHLKGAQLFYPRQLYTCAPQKSPTTTH